MNSRTQSPLRGLGGWLLILCGFSIGIVLWLTPSVRASSRDSEGLAKHDFDSLVHAVSDRYRIHPQTVPMMWLANLCASGFTHGGVRSMKVVEFEDAARIARNRDAPAEFADLVQSQLGDRWTSVIRQHDQGGEDSFIYMQNTEDLRLARLIVVNLDRNELNMVSVSLNPAQLARWLDDHNATHKKASPGD